MTAAWLWTFVSTLLAVCFVLLALGIGMLFGRSPPQRSCGAGGSCVCDRGDHACRLREERT